MEYFFLIAFPWNISDLVASKSISAHEFTIASCSLNDLQQGFGDEKTIFKLSTNSDSSVTCLDTLDNSHVVICTGEESQLFKTKPLKFIRTLSRKPGTRVAKCASNGLVAIGSDEPDIMIKCIFRPEYSLLLSGHKNSVKEFAFHPSGLLLLSCAADGLVKAWVGTHTQNTDPWKCIHTFDDLIGTSVPENFQERYPVAWHPSGSHFAIAGLGGAVHLIQNGSWEKVKIIHHDTVSQVIQHISYSHNGAYLLCLDGANSVFVWDTSSKEELLQPLITMTHDKRLCDASWNTKENAVTLIDESGQVLYWPDFIPSHCIDPNVQIIPASQKEEELAENLFGDDDFDDLELDNDLGAFAELDAIEESAQGVPSSDAAERNELKQSESVNQKETEDWDNLEMDDAGNDLDGFIVDDDGNGYQDDLNGPDAYKRYMETSKKESLRNLEKAMPLDDIEIDQMDRPLFLQKQPEQQIQPSFQSGSIPIKGNRHYLCFNMIGTICAITSATGDQYVFDVSFHDTSQRPFHFTESTKFSIAALGSTGAIFGSTATSVIPSTIYFRPVDTWGNKNDWALSLPEGESVISLAVNAYCLAAATDMQYLRLFAPSGVQTSIRSIPGPIVTIIGNDNHILVVYHEGGVFHGHQSLAYILIDAESGTTVQKDKCPISPLSTLSWIGFSNSGIPLSFDSVGVLRALFIYSDFMWTPAFDSKAFKGTKEETYWPMGCDDKEFFAVICRGSPYPVHPKPLINDLPLQLPFCGIENDQNKMEERAARLRLNLAHQRSTKVLKENVRDLSAREMDLDKIGIQLIMAACKSEQTQRALDLSSFLYSIKSLDGAAKLASYNHLPALVERLTALKEIKMKETEEVVHYDPYSRYNSAPTYQPEHRESRYNASNDYQPSVVRTDYDFGGGSESVQNNDTSDQQSQIFDATQPFQSAQAPPQQQQVESADAPPAKKVAAKKKNPFSMKAKAMIVDLPNPSEEAALEIQKKDNNSAAPQKRKQATLSSFMKQKPDEPAAEKRVKQTPASEPKESAASSSSSEPVKRSKTLFDHFAAAPPKKSDPVPEQAENDVEMQVDQVPNKSIVPENESEQDRQARLAIEDMFDDGAKENRPVSDRKGKSVNPRESISNLDNLPDIPVE